MTADKDITPGTPEPTQAAVAPADPAALPVTHIDLEQDAGFSNPMLEKVRRLLTSTNPELWSIGGPDLTNDFRVPRPRPAYEQVLVRELPNGSLVLHTIQPVQCMYGPGGYNMIPQGPAHYLIEVRDRIFDANKLVDPKFADNFKGKRCDVIANGDIAKSLFIQVKGIIKTFCEQRKRDFDERSGTLSEDILARVEKSDYSVWEKKITHEKEEKITTYQTSLDGLLLEVSMISKGFESSYKLIISLQEFSNSRVAQSVARLCFRKLEEMEQSAQLQKLSGVLKDLGFE